VVAPIIYQIGVLMFYTKELTPNDNKMVLGTEVDQIDTYNFHVIVFDTESDKARRAICRESEINNTIVRLTSQIMNDKKIVNKA